MTEQNKDEAKLIEGHVYDGIQEYDNPMPKWWLYIFYITIAWSVYYVIGISLGWINDYDANLDKENQKIDALVAAAAEASPEVTPELLDAAIESQEFLVEGEAKYASTCSACHGRAGEGGIGPNLTDNAWIHGGSPMDVYHIIDVGVPAKGMAAWGKTLSHPEHVGLVVFMETIRNTNVEGGKEPEGTAWDREQ